MTFRLRIMAWVVGSCVLVIAVMMAAAHHHLEEELRQGRWDRSHPKHPDWIIHNSYSEDEIEDILGELMQLWLWVAGPLIGLSLGAGWLLARRSLRPIEDINRQLGEMKPQSLHGGIRIPEADPVIEGLSTHLNALLERAGDAYRNMAEFSSKVAHELRTPLMLLRMRIEQAPAGTCVEFQEELQTELARLSRYVEQALLAAKAESRVLKPQLTGIELAPLLAGLADDYSLLAAERGLALEKKITVEGTIISDTDLLRQLLHCLLENAVRYASTHVCIHALKIDDQVRMSISNDYREPGRATPGLGLGLRLARGICDACGIGMAIVDRNGRHDVTVEFPVACGSTAPQAGDR